MRIDSIRAVKTQLNKIVSRLAKEGPLLITKNGRACAVLMPLTDADLEVVAFSQNSRFWRLYGRALAQAEEHRGTAQRKLGSGKTARPRATGGRGRKSGLKDDRER